MNNKNNKKKMNLKEKAYTIIKNKIIMCEFAPGEILDEKQLVEELGVSRTPIREALNKIEQENLIKIIPKRGVFVSQITPKTVSDLYQLREQIDPYATKLATPNLDEEKILEFQEFFSNMDEYDYMEAIEMDNKFHSLIIETCNNIYLTRLMDSIYAENQRIRILSAKNSRLKVSAKEHLNIISYMLKRDAEGAMEEMRKHVVSSKETAKKFLFTYR